MLPQPAIKIETTMIISSKARPTNTDSCAIPRASTPAESVPKARLKPLFRVAPTLPHYHNNEKEKKKVNLFIKQHNQRPK